MAGKKSFFNFKSTKGQKITIEYAPEGIVVNDAKAFEGHLKKVVELIQVDDKPKPKEKPKAPSIEEVAGTTTPTTSAVEEVEREQ